MTYLFIDKVDKTQLFAQQKEMESVNKMQCNPGHKVIVCDI